MKVLINIPHVFDPKKGSLYSSENANKREIKEKGLQEATIGNLDRHSRKNYIHASLGKRKKVITREIEHDEIDIQIKVYTKQGATLAHKLPDREGLEVVYNEELENIKIPQFASRKAIEMYDEYDLICYMEDDIAINDLEFFEKLKSIYKSIPEEFDDAT